MGVSGTSATPFGVFESGTGNKYAYAAADPVNGSDPSGQIGIALGYDRLVKFVLAASVVVVAASPIDAHSFNPVGRSVYCVLKAAFSLLDDASMWAQFALDLPVKAPAVSGECAIPIPFPGPVSDTASGESSRSKSEAIPRADPIFENPKKKEPNWVVLAGQCNPGSFIGGSNEHVLVPGLYGFSVQHQPGKTIEELARAGNFRNGNICVTTIESLLAVGPPIAGVVKSLGQGYLWTVAIFPPPMTPEADQALRTIFTVMPNPARAAR